MPGGNTVPSLLGTKSHSLLGITPFADPSGYVASEPQRQMRRLLRDRDGGGARTGRDLFGERAIPLAPTRPLVLMRRQRRLHARHVTTNSAWIANASVGNQALRRPASRVNA